MAFKTFGKTISGSGLLVDGDRLLLQHPQTMAECSGHVVPYQMPHSDGGFLVLAEYGAPDCDTGCEPPAKPKTTCGGCGCSSKASCSCEKKPDPMAGTLLRFEVVGYSGFDTDGVTALVTERGAEGTIKQDWPAGTLVFQAPTGSEFKSLDDRIKAIEDLGCLLAVPRAETNDVVLEGQWRCHDGCWRQAKKDTVITSSGGVLSLPAAGEGETSAWSACWGFDDILNLLNNPNGIKAIDDSGDTTKITLNSGVVVSGPESEDVDTRLSNPRLSDDGKEYVWDVVNADGDVVGEVVQAVPTLFEKCGGGAVDGALVQCDQLKDSDFNVSNGVVSINTKDLCIETSDVLACAEITQLYTATDPDTGCKKLVTADKLNLKIGAWGNTNDTGAALPLSPSDPATYYTRGRLFDDYSNNSIDYDLLNSTRVFCEDINFPCDGIYKFQVGAEGVVDWAQQGQSTFVAFIDGEPMKAGSTNSVDWYDRFTSTHGSYGADLFEEVTAGSHQVCLYMVGANDGEAAAQALFVSGGNSQPRMRIFRTIEEA